MDDRTALAEFLSQHGFRRHTLVRNQIGHLQLLGLLQNAPVDILLDTGAASTVVDLSYCRAKGIPTRDTGKLGGGAGGITLAIHALAARHYRWMVNPFTVMEFMLSILRTRTKDSSRRELVLCTACSGRTF